MKKISLLLICLIIFIISGCQKPANVTDTPSNEESQVNTLPTAFSLGNLDISLKEIMETKKVEFSEGDTKVILDNKDGKYYIAVYTINNNESYDIDIDHSVDVSILCDDNKVYYGDYYENKTGRENVTISKGETKEVMFVCDLEISSSFKELNFKYNNEEFNYKR